MIENSEQLVDAISQIVFDWELQCEMATRNGGEGKLYVPANLTQEKLKGLCEDPKRLKLSHGNTKETSYTSLELAQQGTNPDGSIHHGFLVIDVYSCRVLDLIDLNGDSLLGGYVNTPSVKVG